MKLKAHFTGIEKVIISHLNEAKQEVLVAVAWFTDEDIFEVLCKLAANKVKVSIAVIGDKINLHAKALRFNRLTALGGDVHILENQDGRQPLMHHKFCVIDRRVVITGSYNWSKKARKNDENITVAEDVDNFPTKFIAAFNIIITRSETFEAQQISSDAIKHRLEVIKNFILLEETEDLLAHAAKLKKNSTSYKLSQILSLIESGEYKETVEHIDHYLANSKALVTAESGELLLLSLRLQTLELRHESISDETAELERTIVLFNRRRADALGDITAEILLEKSRLSTLLAEAMESAEDRETAKENAEEATRTYREYKGYHEENIRLPPPPKLDRKEEIDLKKLYRLACNLCHPDKVDDSQKNYAHEVFVELQTAYKGNNIDRVQEIYNSLRTGETFNSKSSTLSEIESIRFAIAVLEKKINEATQQLLAQQKSSPALMIRSAGPYESDWDAYFAKAEISLKSELVSIREEITQLVGNATA